MIFKDWWDAYTARGTGREGWRVRELPRKAAKAAWIAVRRASWQPLEAAPEYELIWLTDGDRVYPGRWAGAWYELDAHSLRWKMAKPTAWSSAPGLPEQKND